MSKGAETPHAAKPSGGKTQRGNERPRVSGSDRSPCAPRMSARRSRRRIPRSRSGWRRGTRLSPTYSKRRRRSDLLARCSACRAPFHAPDDRTPCVAKPSRCGCKGTARAIPGVQPWPTGGVPCRGGKGPSRPSPRRQGPHPPRAGPAAPRPIEREHGRGVAGRRLRCVAGVTSNGSHTDVGAPRGRYRGSASISVSTSEGSATFASPRRVAGSSSSVSPARSQSRYS